VLSSLIKKYEGQKSTTFNILLPGGTGNGGWIDKIPSGYRHVILHNKKYTITQLLDTLLYIVIHKPKVVIVMSKSQIIPCYMAKIFNPKMKVISWNHFSVNVTRSSKILWLFRLCNAHLSISSGISRQLVDLGIDKRDVFTIYNPIKRPQFLIPRSSNSRKKLYYIGRIQFEQQKNMKELFEILSIVEVPWCLTIIGTGDKQDIAKLKALSHKLSIDKHIMWIGWVEDPWKQIKSADAVVLSSNFEGLPMILCESIAHGVPVFSSNCETGPEDIVDNKYNGELYRLHDIRDGKEKLERILKTSKKYSDEKKISTTAAKFSEDTYFLRFKKIVDGFLS